MADHILQTVKKSSDAFDKTTTAAESENPTVINQAMRDSQRRTTGSVTALDILHEERSAHSIVTFSAAVDEMLGGGVPLGKITEFCGAPGSGKTQMW